MKLSKNFELEEFIRSETATKLGIDNRPSPEIIANIQLLVDTVLQPVRDQISYPFHINSGYRSPALNKAVKGSSRSAHLQGLAADITLGSKQLNKILYKEITSGKYIFDQAINEYDYSWIHLGIRSTLEENRRQIFAIN